MKRRGPHFRLVLSLIIAAFATSLAYSQAVPKYDKSTETTVKGAVSELKLVPPDGPKPVAYLTLKTGSDTAQIFLCPKKFLDDMGIAFKADDAVQVVGSKVKQDSGDLILAREVTLNGETITFRFADGKPAW